MIDNIFDDDDNFTIVWQLHDNDNFMDDGMCKNIMIASRWLMSKLLMIGDWMMRGERW
jgi:hypothetical protein